MTYDGAHEAVPLAVAGVHQGSGALPTLTATNNTLAAAWSGPLAEAYVGGGS